MSGTGPIAREICEYNREAIGRHNDAAVVGVECDAGVSLNTDRVHLGTAVLPGFIYLLGGSDGVMALDTTEWLNW